MGVCELATVYATATRLSWPSRVSSVILFLFTVQLTTGILFLFSLRIVNKF